MCFCIFSRFVVKLGYIANVFVRLNVKGKKELRNDLKSIKFVLIFYYEC